MFFSRKRLGSKSGTIGLSDWFLTAQRHLEQALVIYTGRHVQLRCLDIRTTKEVKMRDRTFREIEARGWGVIYRVFPHTHHDVKATIVLVQESNVWRVEGERFIFSLEQSLTPYEDGPKHYEAVFTYSDDTREAPEVMVRYLLPEKKDEYDQTARIGHSLADRRLIPWGGAVAAIGTA